MDFHNSARAELFIYIFMTRRNLILIALVLVAFVAGIFVFRPAAEVPIVPEPVTATTTDQAESTTETPAPVADPIFATAKTETVVALKAVEAPKTATLMVEGASFAIRSPEGATLEQAMADLKAGGVLSYKLRNYTGLGAFVEEIQGKANTSEYCWILYVNGKKSATGISQTRISSGDVIEWKYEHKY